MKRLMSLLLIAALALMLATPVFAAGEYESGIEAYDDSSWEEWIAAQRMEMGGPETGPGVMYNGAYIAFSDAFPEFSGNRIMVPFRALAETMGFQVDYLPDTREITASLGGVEVKFYIGANEMLAVADGVERTIAMDTVSYIKNGRIYVPIRSVCELAGCDVFWDSTYETAIVFNRAAIIDKIDQNFTVVNKLYTIGRQDQTKTYKTVADLGMGCTLFDSVGGDGSFDIDIGVKTLQKGLNSRTSLTADLSQLVALMVKEGMLDADGAELLGSLSDVSINVITSSDDNCIYMQSDLFETLMPGMDGDAWLKFSGDLGLGAQSSWLLQETPTVGALVYALSTGYADIHTYESLVEAAGYLAFLSDDMFVKSGNTYTMSIGPDNYEAFLKAVLGGEYDETALAELTDAFQELSLTLKITDANGKVSAAGSFAVCEDPDDMRIAGSFSLSDEKTDLKLELHVKNELKLNLELSSTTVETSETFIPAPPDGSAVVDAGDLSEYVNTYGGGLGA